jgi:hypothetical protein
MLVLRENLFGVFSTHMRTSCLHIDMRSGVPVWKTRNSANHITKLTFAPNVIDFFLFETGVGSAKSA